MSVPFSPEQVAEFRSRGFLIVRGLADPALRADILTVARRHLEQHIAPIEYEADTNYPGAPRSRDAEGGRTARRLLQVFERDEAFQRWALHRAVTERVRQLLDGGPIALTQAHHNSLMSKQPAFSSETRWHRDIRYWAFETPDLVSVWLALGREYPENGSLGFLPGSNQLDLPAECFDERAFLRTDLPQNRALIEQAHFTSLEPGDVVFFHAMTFHAAGWNRTDQTKHSLVYSYHRQDNLPLAGTRSASLPSVRID
ncbi:phytanoyl-CoA dioxygenase family protein [Chitinimonas lacunae]|uniref:Phytanoyl-CoA dioxygenase family protein n=1 Tax=Chitinimonas lacunae TaxID=1963018 RepID=A0ABV8MX19_9NEIS